MRILHITGEYPPFVLGGLGIYVREVAHRLKQRGHDIKVLVLQGRISSYNRVYAGTSSIRVIRKTFNPEKYAASINELIDPMRVISIFNLNKILSINPDIVHIHDWYGALWGTAISQYLSIPLVMTSHLPLRAGFIYTGHPFPIKLKMQLEALGIRNSSIILTPSKFVSRTLINEYNAEEKFIRVIPNGVDVDFFFNNGNSNTDKRLIPGAPKFLTVCRLTEQKGLIYLLEVASKFYNIIPSATFTIAGDGPLKGQLKLECARRKLTKTVNLVGFQNRKSLRKLYKDSTIFINTSIYEPFGLVILEAMACGTPVVAFDVGGVSELIKDGESGLLVSPCDTTGITRAILLYLNNLELYRSMSVAGRKKAQMLSWNNIVNKIENLYLSLRSYDKKHG